MNWEDIRKEFEESNITLAALAEKHGLKLGTLKSRKSREGWTRGSPATASKRDATKSKKVATIQEEDATQKPRYPNGHPGNKSPKNQFPKRNQAAVKHGFFSKFLPEETLEIMEQLQESSPADLIWDQIQIQYAAIIRAQRIMYVTDQEDMTKELRKTKETYSDKGGGSEEEYEIQFAWDKHATFLNAQSRAMSELRNLVKQFDEMAHVDDERRLKMEQMRLGIKKTEAEISKISAAGDEDKPTEIVIRRKEGRS